MSKPRWRKTSDLWLIVRSISTEPCVLFSVLVDADMSNDLLWLCRVMWGAAGAFLSSYKNVRFRGRQRINNVSSTPLCPMLTEQQMKIENLYLCWLWKYHTDFSQSKNFPQSRSYLQLSTQLYCRLQYIFPPPSWNKPWVFSARVPRFSARCPPRPPSRVSGSGCKFSDSLSRRGALPAQAVEPKRGRLTRRIVKERTGPIVSRTELKADIESADVAANGAQKCDAVGNGKCSALLKLKFWVKQIRSSLNKYISITELKTVDSY